MRKKIKSPFVIRSWKKFMFCGCSHGRLASESALDAAIDFKNSYKPDKTIHSGDFIDTAAWRTSSKGTKDEIDDVSLDVESGLTFLERLRPTTVFNGNHEIRIWKHAAKPNALISHAAKQTICQLRDFICNELKSEYVEDYVYEKSWRRLGNFLVGHGFSFDSHATKTHADKMGNCMFCHLHRLEVARGTRADRPVGISAGYLGDREKFTYADQWESRFRWNTGWVYGEYTDNEVIWQIHQHRDKNEEPKKFMELR